MATQTFQVGHIANGNEVVVRSITTMPPFAKPNCQIMQVYSIADGDYGSGDDLVFEFKSITKVFAIGTDQTGAEIAYAEAALSGAWDGLKLTFSGVTATKFKLFAITDL